MIVNKDIDIDSLKWKEEKIIKMQLFLNNALPLLLEEIDDELVEDIKEGYYLINDYLNREFISIKNKIKEGE